jgi:hypothetical protein
MVGHPERDPEVSTGKSACVPESGTEPEARSILEWSAIRACQPAVTAVFQESPVDARLKSIVLCQSTDQHPESSHLRTRNAICRAMVLIAG